MEGICVGKGIVIGVKVTFGLFGFIKWAVVCTTRLQRSNEASAILLHLGRSM